MQRGENPGRSHERGRRGSGRGPRTGQTAKRGYASQRDDMEVDQPIHKIIKPTMPEIPPLLLDQKAVALRRKPPVEMMSSEEAEGYAQKWIRCLDQGPVYYAAWIQIFINEPIQNEGHKELNDQKVEYLKALGALTAKDNEQVAKVNKEEIIWQLDTRRALKLGKRGKQYMRQPYLVMRGGPKDIDKMSRAERSEYGSKVIDWARRNPGVEIPDIAAMIFSQNEQQLGQKVIELVLIIKDAMKTATSPLQMQGVLLPIFATAPPIVEYFAKMNVGWAVTHNQEYEDNVQLLSEEQLDFLAKIWSSFPEDEEIAQGMVNLALQLVKPAQTHMISTLMQRKDLQGIRHNPAVTFSWLVRNQYLETWMRQDRLNVGVERCCDELRETEQSMTFWNDKANCIIKDDIEEVDGARVVEVAATVLWCNWETALVRISNPTLNTWNVARQKKGYSTKMTNYGFIAMPNTGSEGVEASDCTVKKWYPVQQTTADRWGGRTTVDLKKPLAAQIQLGTQLRVRIQSMEDYGAAPYTRKGYPNVISPRREPSWFVKGAQFIPECQRKEHTTVGVVTMVNSWRQGTKPDLRFQKADSLRPNLQSIQISLGITHTVCEETRAYQIAFANPDRINIPETYTNGALVVVKVVEGERKKLSQTEKQKRKETELATAGNEEVTYDEKLGIQAYCQEIVTVPDNYADLMLRMIPQTEPPIPTKIQGKSFNDIIPPSLRAYFPNYAERDYGMTLWAEFELAVVRTGMKLEERTMKKGSVTTIYKEEASPTSPLPTTVFSVAIPGPEWLEGNPKLQEAIRDMKLKIHEPVRFTPTKPNVGGRHQHCGAAPCKGKVIQVMDVYAEKRMVIDPGSPLWNPETGALDIDHCVDDTGLIPAANLIKVGTKYRIALSLESSKQHFQDTWDGHSTRMGKLSLDADNTLKKMLKTECRTEKLMKANRESQQRPEEPMEQGATPLSRRQKENLEKEELKKGFVESSYVSIISKGVGVKAELVRVPEKPSEGFNRTTWMGDPAQEVIPDDQQAAAMEAIAELPTSKREMIVILGPPGTGKTFTVYASVLKLLLVNGAINGDLENWYTETIVNGVTTRKYNYIRVGILATTNVVANNLALKFTQIQNNVMKVYREQLRENNPEMSEEELDRKVHRLGKLFLRVVRLSALSHEEFAQQAESEELWAVNSNNLALWSGADDQIEPGLLKIRQEYRETQEELLKTGEKYKQLRVSQHMDPWTPEEAKEFKANAERMTMLSKDLKQQIADAVSWVTTAEEGYQPNVVITTVGQAQHQVFRSMQGQKADPFTRMGFNIIICEEASQIPALVGHYAIAKRLEKGNGAQGLVLAGDYNQLAPFVRQPGPAGDVARTSTMERLAQPGESLVKATTPISSESYILGWSDACRIIMEPLVNVITLNTSYRTTEAGFSFISPMYYQGRLKTSKTLKESRNMDSSLMYVVPMTNIAFPYWLIATKSREEIIHGHTRGNREFARQVVMIARILISGGIEPEQIQILCLYEGQKYVIRKLTSQIFDPSHLLNIPEEEWKFQPNTAQRLEPLCVDAFQGSEADYIILDTTRCSPQSRIDKLVRKPAGSKIHPEPQGPPTGAPYFPTMFKEGLTREAEFGVIGFMSDIKRLNVSLSRQRKGIFTVIDPTTADASWDWYKFNRWNYGNGSFWPFGAFSFERYAAFPATHWYDADYNLRTIDQLKMDFPDIQPPEIEACGQSMEFEHFSRGEARVTSKPPQGIWENSQRFKSVHLTCQEEEVELLEGDDVMQTKQTWCHSPADAPAIKDREAYTYWKQEVEMLQATEQDTQVPSTVDFRERDWEEDDDEDNDVLELS